MSRLVDDSCRHSWPPGPSSSRRGGLAATGRRRGRRTRAPPRRPGAAPGSAERRRFGSVSRLSQPVAGAADGQDQLRLARVLLDLLPQVANMDVDRARLPVGGVAPDRLQQRASAEDLPRLSDERPQQLELDVRELERAAVDRSPRAGPGRATGCPRRARRPRGRRGGRAPARRRSARTRLRNSRIENGFVM